MSQAMSDPAIGEQVRAEQVRTLYGQSTPVLLANVLNAGILSAVLWTQVSAALLVGWTGAMTLMALVRLQMRRRYGSHARGVAEQARWGRLFTLGSLSAGILWGFAGCVLLPDSLPHQMLIVFVLGGMASGAAASIACFMPAYYAYSLPALVPTALRLVSFGRAEQLAMAAMLVLFVAALTLVARNVHRALVEAFRLRFENAGLFAQISRTQASLVEANENLHSANERLETRVRQRTEELQASEQQLSEIVSESPEAIVVFDESGLIISANPAAERIAGRPAAALIGKHFTASGALPPADAARALDAFCRVLAGHAHGVEEFHIIHPDGQILLIEVTVRVVRGLDGKRRLHVVARDVTERHRVQRLKEAYEARLHESERLESIGMLAGGVAHDFNNLLTMILGNVDLLERRFDANPKALLGEIRHGSLQAAELTNQLLAFSRKQLLDVKPTDIGKMVNDARAVFERALGDGIRLSISLPSDPAVVLVDATQLEQAVLNLLVNACHAMPDGGTVELEVRIMHVNEEADWPEAEPGSYVRLSVSDTGTGMDEATRRRVFEPFFTTKELGRGTGLGLSTVHGLIKQAGGQIRVTSEAGKGSRFELLLPCHAMPALGAAPDALLGSASFGTALVVDDQPQLRRFLRLVLEDAGYQVLVAEGGAQALEFAQKRNGRIDIVVSDISMPGMSGVELTRRLLALYPQLAILLVSGYAGSEVASIADLGDGVQFLAKPFDAATLTSAAQMTIRKARAAASLGQRAAELAH